MICQYGVSQENILAVQLVPEETDSANRDGFSPQPIGQGYDWCLYDPQHPKCMLALELR